MNFSETESLHLKNKLVVKLKIFVVILALFQLKCSDTTTSTPVQPPQDQEDFLQGEAARQVVVGASRMDAYLSDIQDKNIAMVVNQTSTIDEAHLVDILNSTGVNIKTIFAPEHGFRGMADAGEKIEDNKDPQTGIPIISLYGKKRAPSAADLAGIDYVLFDIQDVGARFYTYISTMHYVMKACAENDVKMMVLDRPNPNSYYVDGPVLEPEQQSFVGMHPGVPVVHGMTIGEYAKMINGEGWLGDGLKCDLEVIPCNYYAHSTVYLVPIKPSPNLPNNRAIQLYPSLCLFEGTVVSVGRGTDKQFQVYGHPDYPEGDFTFTPEPMPGAKNPRHDGETCRGYDLTDLELQEIIQKKQLNLEYLLKFYENFPDKSAFFLENKYFDKLAGTSKLREQITAGKSESEIRESWENDLEKFKDIREKYLIYEE